MKLSDLKIPDLPREGKLYSIWVNERYYELGDDGDTLIESSPSASQTAERKRISGLEGNNQDGARNETIRRLK